MKNTQSLLAEEYINGTGTSVFLTGKAGTGKTTFLKHICETTSKRCITVAPTGVAAINAGGSTIHSFFQLPFSLFLPDVPEYISEYNDRKRMTLRKNKIDIIRSIELLIIDEISMVRADLLDAIDDRLRRYRRNSRPFGGVQLLMIGDLQQLPPIVSDEEMQYLQRVYPSPFFFNSIALKKLKYITIELSHVYRQPDMNFVNLLNNIRQNRFDSGTLEMLNARYNPDFDPSDKEHYIRLTTHNAQADRINTSKLESLKGRKHDFDARVEGSFPEYMYPTEYTLKLKVGAQVMFVRNDPSPDKLYFNGKIVTVTGFSDEGIITRDSSDEKILVTPVTWENTKYVINGESKEIESVVEGTFTQVPLRLAWAITIHKSQGLTFDKAIIDVGRAFTFGQTYVALSRCRTLEGIVLSSRITANCAFSNTEVNSFNDGIPPEEEVRNNLDEARAQYFYDLLTEAFDFSDLEKAVSQIASIFLNKLHSLYTQESDTFRQKAQSLFYPGIINVAEKFRHQISSLQAQCGSDTKNAYLQERINKASVYFSEKITEFDESISGLLDLEIENQETNNEYVSATELYNESLGLKQAVFKAVGQQFTTELYIKTKNDFLLSDRSYGKKTQNRKKVNLKGCNEEFFNLLREWRSEKSFEKGKQPFTILTQSTMLEIASKLPKDRDSLLAVSGFGKQKMADFGTEIPEMVNSFCDANGIKPKLHKGETYEITLNMFRKGTSAEDIAAERGLSLSTVEGHLSRLVKDGKLDVSDVLPQDDFRKILGYFRKNPETTLNEAHAFFGGSYEYYKLSIVNNYCKENDDAV